MIATDLTTRRVELPDGGRALPYEWEGETVLVRDDAETVLECISLLRDEDAPAEEKSRRFMGLFFADWRDAYAACDYDPARLGRLIEDAVWDVCGLDIAGGRQHDRPLWDPVEDAAIIRTSLRQAYGIDWDEVRGEVSFAEFVALVGGVPRDTPLGMAIHYRNPKTRPKPAKRGANRKEIEEWDRLHRALALRCRSSRGAGEKGQSDGAMRDAFAALKRAAR